MCRRPIHPPAIQSLFTFTVGLSILALMAGCSGPVDEGPAGSVTITTPSQGATLTEAHIEVRGTASQVDLVEVNGREADVVGGEWNVDLQLDQGEGRVTARAGGATDAVDVTVDSYAPRLSLQAPARGTYIEAAEGDTVEVTGEASDGGMGLRLVSIQNEPVELADDGSFSGEATLEEGMNVIEVEAVDEAGNTETGLRTVMHGSFVDPTEPAIPGIALRVTDSAIDTTTRVAEDVLSPERITKVVRQRVDTENFSISKVDYETLDIEATPESSGKIALSVDVTALEMEGDATISGETFPIVVTIDEATLTTKLAIEVDEQNDLTFAFDEPELKLAPEDFHFALRGSMGNKEEIDQQALRNLAVRAAKHAIAGVLREEVVNQLWDPSILKREIELLGRRLVFEIVPQLIRVRSDGIYVETAISMPADRYGEVAEVPGALTRPLGEWNIIDEMADSTFRTNRTAIERMVHGVWRSGLLHQSLRGKDFAGYELPVELTAGALSFGVDGRIGSLADDDTPVAIHLRPKVPPVVSLQPATDGAGEGESEKVGVQMGDLMVDLTLEPEEGEPIRVATLAVYLDADVEIGLDGVALELGFEADARADVAAEPEIDFDDGELESMVAGIMNTFPSLLSDNITIEGKSDFKWVTLEKPRLRVHGQQNDRITVLLDVAPAEEGQLP